MPSRPLPRAFRARYTRGGHPALRDRLARFVGQTFLLSTTRAPLTRARREREEQSSSSSAKEGRVPSRRLPRMRQFAIRPCESGWSGWSGWEGRERDPSKKQKKKKKTQCNPAGWLAGSKEKGKGDQKKRDVSRLEIKSLPAEQSKTPGVLIALLFPRGQPSSCENGSQSVTLFPPSFLIVHSFI